MDQLLGLLDNALLQGLGYGVAVIGLAIAFRVLKYPDLTADGSFLIGAAVFGAMLTARSGWLWASLAAFGAGSATGAVTALLHTIAGVNRLLSGILTSMMCYSVAFWILAGRSNLNLTDRATMFTPAEALDANSAWAGWGVHAAVLTLSAIVAGSVISIVYLLLRSDLGVVLRAVGDNAGVVQGIGRRPNRYVVLGLTVANGLVGLSGCLISARQGFADINMGFGVVITLVAALVIGEEAMRLFRADPSRSLAARVASGVLGACIYFFLYLLVLRASILGWIPVRIQPTDLKLMSAAIVVAVVAFRTYGTRQPGAAEEVLPV